MSAPPSSHNARTDVDIVIVGAGFAGLYMLHAALQLGFTARVFEAGDGVGGTWYWNRYPGARCDVESMQYSYSFSSALQDEWRWSERYASQPEILRYAQHVAERFALYPHISFGTRVVALSFVEATGLWRVRTDRGTETSATYVVMATGALSSPQKPELPGLARYAGRVFYTAEWPHEAASFAGERVAVIGTGSSGIQAIPQIAEAADHLTVFQRTPNYSIPAHNRAMSEAEERRWKSAYGALRAEARASPNGILMKRNPAAALSVSEEERTRVYETYWSLGSLEFMAAFADLRENRSANETAAEFVRAKIRHVVRDPQTAAMLTPTDYPIGSKRVCVDTGYYQTFNRGNVELVDITATPIETVMPEGILTARGFHRLDTIVFATGFDAFTGALLKVDIRGRGGASLAEAWADGAKTYLGLMVAKFPNLLILTGPGSPSVFGNVIVAIEQHVEFVAALLERLRAGGYATVEASEAAQRSWRAHCNDVASRTLYPQAASWWTGANIDGKPRTLLPYAGGFDTYGRILSDVADKGYDGMILSRARARTGSN